MRPRSLGKNSLISGKIMVSASANIIATYSGRIGFIISLIDTFPILHPTNKTLPTGGVHRPIDKFKIIIIPKCKGDMFSISAMGKNMGVNISTAGVTSMNVPTTSKIRFIIRSIMIAFSDTDRSELLIACGISS